ncbi:hypothetical protein D3C73_1250270 [compost metagenome]
MRQLHAHLLGNIGDAEAGIRQLFFGELHPFELYIMHRGYPHEFFEIRDEIVRMQMHQLCQLLDLKRPHQPLVNIFKHMGELALITGMEQLIYEI